MLERSIPLNGFSHGGGLGFPCLIRGTSVGLEFECLQITSLRESACFLSSNQVVISAIEPQSHIPVFLECH